MSQSSIASGSKLYTRDFSHDEHMPLSGMPDSGKQEKKNLDVATHALVLMVLNRLWL